VAAQAECSKTMCTCCLSVRHAQQGPIQLRIMGARVDDMTLLPKSALPFLQGEIKLKGC